MLMLLLGHRITQKRGGKWDMVGPVGSGSFKVVFTLLTKVVVVQMRIPIIEVGKPGFQRLLSKLCLDWSKKQSLILILQVDFYELLEQPISRSRNRN